jgi:hypothetical protein
MTGLHGRQSPRQASSCQYSLVIIQSSMMGSMSNKNLEGVRECLKHFKTAIAHLDRLPQEL